MKTISFKNDISLMEISSPAFAHWKYIPKKYTCDGENINPPFIIHKIPRDAKSMVLLMDNASASEKCLTHWLVWNIDPVKQIEESSVPGIQGVSDFNIRKYLGPCQDSGTHVFQFRIFALRKKLTLDPTCGKYQVEKAMTPHILAFGFIAGFYGRNLKGSE